MQEESQFLPHKIQARILRGKSGVFIAELPEYDVSTEADTLWALDDQINDLIFTLFEVPKKFQKLIRYVSEASRKQIDIAEKYFIFQKFINSEAERLFR